MTLPFQLKVAQLDHQHHCPTVEVAIHESLQITWINEALHSGGRSASSSPSEFPRIKHTSSYFPVQLMLFAARSTHFSHYALKTGSVSPRHSFNLKTVTAHSSDLGSGSSASSKAFCFWIGTLLSSVSFWRWEVGNSKTNTASLCANLGAWFNILGLGTK